MAFQPGCVTAQPGFLFPSATIGSLHKEKTSHEVFTYGILCLVNKSTAKLQSLNCLSDHFTLLVPGHLYEKFKSLNNQFVIVEGNIERQSPRFLTGSIKLAINCKEVFTDASKFNVQNLSAREKTIISLLLTKKLNNCSAFDVDKYLANVKITKRRPKIAIIWPSRTVVKTEFAHALSNGIDNYELYDYSVYFSQQKLVDTIRLCDNKDFDAIAIVRGGGAGLNVLDDEPVLSAVVKMKKPLIVATGHAEDKLLLKILADRVLDTPTAFGYYLKELFEQTQEDFPNNIFDKVTSLDPGERLTNALNLHYKPLYHDPNNPIL